MAGVVRATAFACGAERLTRITGEDDVESAAEWPGIETAQIVPYWCRSEIPGALGRDEDGARPVFPFDEGTGVETGFGEHEAQIQASAACAEGKSVPGT